MIFLHHALNRSMAALVLVSITGSFAIHAKPPVERPDPSLVSQGVQCGRGAQEQ